MSFTDYPTRKDAENEATEYADPLDRLIDPVDVDDDADTWSEIDPDTLREEISRSVSIIRAEHQQIRGLIQDHAFKLWTDNLVRQPRDVLDDDISDTDLIHEYGIWPYDMDMYECYEICHEVYETPGRNIPQGFIDEAETTVMDGLFDGSIPSSIEL